MNKFEKLIEYIINDEDQKARELFHTIVVEKSRDIYESIMDEENMEEMVHGDQVENMVDEIGHEEAVGETEEEFADAGEEDLTGDEGGEFGGEEHGAEEGNPAEEEIEDKVMSIDAKLDELLAKFDEIMGDEGHGEEVPAEEPAMDMGHEEPEMAEMGVMEAADDEEEEEEEEEESKEPKGKAVESRSNKSTSEMMREYVDKIQDMNLTGASEGDAVGAAGKKTSVNNKSITGPGADFGGTANIAKGGEQNQDGARPASTPKPQEIKSGNVNTPGGDAGKSGFKTKEGSYETDGDGQGNPTGKMAGTGKNTPASGDSNPKSPLKQNSGKK